MKSTIYWITGLSGSGKTTLSNKLSNHLFNMGRSVVRLDGDEIRKVLRTKNALSRNERSKLGVLYAKLAKMLSVQGHDIVVSTISLFNEVHRWNRLNNKNLKYIFLDVPIYELVKRDSKKIYSKSNNNIAGINFKIDVPSRIEVHIKWKKNMTKNKIFKEVIKRLKLVN